MSAMFLDSETAFTSDQMSIELDATKQKRCGEKARLVQLTLGLFMAAVFVGTFHINSNALLPLRAWGATARPSDSSLIVPGKSVGLVHLRDTRETVLDVLPLKKDMDREYAYRSGSSEIDWLDQESHDVRGEVRFFLRDGRIFQIASATPRFRTRSGITIYTPPDTVKRNCPALRSYVLLNSGGEEVGGRDLVYWVNRAKGIAFEFHFYPKRRRRLVYSVIVFEPDSDFFPRGESVSSNKWRELPPYSLESSPDIAAK